MKSAPRRRTRAVPAIDILIRCPLWNEHRGIGSLLRRAVAEAALLTARGGELAIVLADDAAIRVLNRHWRHKDGPTNVLSFPACEWGARSRKDRRKSGRETRPGTARIPDMCRHLGDIVIAYQTADREAKAGCKPLKHHVAHLAVHGFLHLVGYDHHADREAEAMEALEIAALTRIRVPNPYIAGVPNG